MPDQWAAGASCQWRQDCWAWRQCLPITTTLPLESRPSMSASSVLTMLLWIWSCLLLLTCRLSTLSSSPCKTL